MKTTPVEFTVDFGSSKSVTRMRARQKGHQDVEYKM